MGIKSGNTTVYAEGGNSYAFTVRVSDDYSSIIKELKVGETLDVSKYLSKDISKYSISAYDSKVIGYSKGIITANSNGTSYIICDGNRESIQIIVKVSGTVSNNVSKIQQQIKQTQQVRIIQLMQQTRQKKRKKLLQVHQ